MSFETNHFGDGAAGTYGWRKSPAEVRRILATLPFPRFAQAAPHLEGTGAGKDALLFVAAYKVLGKNMPAQQQPRGTCVSRGWSRAGDYCQLVDIGFGGLAEEFQYLSHAAVYGMAKEIGHDLSYQDGAVGAWAAKAVSQWGCVTNEDAGDVDAGNDDLAVEWGAKKIPQKIKDLAKPHLVKTVTLVTAPEQARDLLVNGYPLAVCSDQGFSMTRDSEGHCRASGSWNHCMMWSGFRADKNWFLVEQSWGQNTPSGPLWKDPVTGYEMPDNSFWIDWGAAARMLSQEDSFALSGFQGFPAREIHWRI